MSGRSQDIHRFGKDQTSEYRWLYLKESLRWTNKARELSRPHLCSVTTDIISRDVNILSLTVGRGIISSYEDLVEPAWRWPHSLFPLNLHCHIQSSESWVLKIYIIHILKMLSSYFFLCLNFCHWCFIPLFMLFPSSPAPCCLREQSSLVDLMQSFLVELCLKDLTSALHKYSSPTESTSLLFTSQAWTKSCHLHVPFWRLGSRKGYLICLLSLKSYVTASLPLSLFEPHFLSIELLDLIFCWWKSLVLQFWPHQF